MLQMVCAVVLGLVAYKFLRVALYFVIGIVFSLFAIKKMKDGASDLGSDSKRAEA